MGGGVMRTAAKVGIAGGAAAAAKSGRFRHAAPAFATAAAAAGSEAAPLVSASGGEAVPPATAQWAASWELDDWEFADWRDDSAAAAVVVAEREATAAAAKPRLVFAPPSREEAEEATSELRDAIERAYFNETPVEVVKEQDKEFNKQATDAIIPSMPGHVVQAFTLLKSSPEAQSVVASLASDRNVWEAVLKNEKVMEFYKNHQTTLVETFPEEAATVESPGNFEDATSENASNTELPTGSPFSDFVDNAKKRVMDVIYNITDFFKDLFDSAGAQDGAGPSAEKGPSAAEMALGGSFMALAIGVILVVLLKRA
ncbi:uncharacterized protein LOC8084995 [Sorghum bicolor]|uniref:Uncharacterized protein n=1 Tax=Sorghum bicolor TaxID=4558 RepID=C5YHY0_SORBI|nr:uncharacterized protein LOC8084995 [Sorghum bicolor]EES13447.1 hypothetical protein SORBI_3007G062500 [Sorghum bicolor]|eukprot:XP_002443952.1 uncharacterized protein LOC8084995 [Sorghum bicolor]